MQMGLFNIMASGGHSHPTRVITVNRAHTHTHTPATMKLNETNGYYQCQCLGRATLHAAD